MPNTPSEMVARVVARVAAEPTREAAGPRPKTFKKWEDDAEKVEKGLASLAGQIAQIEHDGDITSDEAHDIFKRISQAQKALSSAIDQVDRIY